VRLGSPDDCALQWLPGILSRFARTHPGIEVDVLCMSSDELAQRLEHGHLDLALVTEGHGREGEELWRGSLRWVGPQGAILHKRDPLPLATAHPGCNLRRAALEALGQAGRRVRVCYNCNTQSGCFAVALAGLAITISTPTRLPPGLVWLGEADGLPVMAEMGIFIAQGDASLSPGGQALMEAIRAGFAQVP